MVKDLIPDLNARFALGDQLRFDLDPHGMERAIIKTAHAQATIYLHGAHITHFQPTGHKPLLFLSSKSNFAPGKAIRGGIPIIYPWFGPKRDDPTAPMHGFARTSEWQIEKTDLDAKSALLVFSLDNLRYIVRISQTLELTLEVKNNSPAPLTFEDALHTYFAVFDVCALYIHGLSNQTYIDKTDGMKRKTSPPQPLWIQSETDRVYVNSQTLCLIDDPDLHRQIRIEKFNSATTVVWNPWIEKAKKMPDFADDEWQKMLCLETANAADNAITLPPGAVHAMSAIISVNDSMTQ